MPSLRFDEPAHEYYLDHDSGRSEKLPSVTEIIDHFGLINAYSKNKEAAIRGQYIHKAAEFLFEHRLNWSSLDERILGYIQSLEKWITLTGFVAERCEVQLYHPELLYAGTFDVTGHMPNGSTFICDIKSGEPQPWHGIQLAAYLLMLGGYRKRGGIYLRANGAVAKFKEYRARDDAMNFVSMLNVYRLQQTYRVKEKQSDPK